LDYIDNTIKSTDDIERYVGLPTLGVIPSLSSSTQGSLLDTGLAARRALPAAGSSSNPVETVTLLNTRSALAEAYRSLRTSVLLSAAQAAPRFLLVTSAQPGEGKTTTAVNLAITLAQAGRKVLLVDADLRKPRCHKVLHMPGAPGLSNYLAGILELKQVIQPAPVPNLFLVPSGPIPPNPSELLGSARLRELLASLPDSVHHVLFDSPPVLSISDAMQVATEVDGVMLVVRSGTTPREMVVRSRQQLESVSAKMTGVVLNGIDSAYGSDYYYFYSKYDYTYGQEPSTGHAADAN
jgi:capsular exopolysaccharide synthesis family protein